jgi:hypothetical protein
MSRWTSNTLTMLSLVLLLATLPLWAASYRAPRPLVLYESASPARPPPAGFREDFDGAEYRRSATVSAGRFRVVGYHWPRPPT